jgi:hypothetical protein
MREFSKTSAPEVKTVQEVILLGKPPAGRAPLDQRRGERELFFWTAREVLKLVAAVAFTIYLLVSLVTGHDPVPPGLSFWK